MTAFRWTAAAVLLIMTDPAWAQSPDSTESLQLALRLVRTITVTDVNGRQFKGDVVRFNGTWLTIERPRWNQDLTLDLRRIETIKERDSLRNGAALGFLGGLAAAVVVVKSFCDYQGNGADCKGDAELFFGAPIVGASIAVGIGIDYAHQRTLYQAAAPPRRIVFSPIIGRAMGGGSLSLRF